VVSVTDPYDRILGILDRLMLYEKITIFSTLLNTSRCQYLIPANDRLCSEISSVSPYNNFMFKISLNSTKLYSGKQVIFMKKKKT
jgi:hypothetical protein